MPISIDTIRRFHDAGRQQAVAVIDKWLDPQHIKLHAGEMTAQEMRSVLAVLRGIRAEIVDR